MDNRSSLLIILLDEIDFQNNKGLDDQKVLFFGCLLLIYILFLFYIFLCL